MRITLLKKLQSASLTLLLLVFVLPSSPVLAAKKLSEAELQRQGIWFYDPEAEPYFGRNCNSSASSQMWSVSGTTASLLEKNKSVYETVAQKFGIPWQVIAALHYREHNMISDSNPSSGQGVYQLYSLYKSGTVFPPGPIDTTEFQRQTEIATEFFLKKGTASQVESIKVGNAAALKEVFFSYNGRAESLGKQNLIDAGLDPNLPPVEGNAYTMNQYDAARMNLKIQAGDNSTNYVVDKRPGAFTIYEKLGGPTNGPAVVATGSPNIASANSADSGSVTCNSTSDSSSVVDIAKAELGNNEADKSYLKYTDGVAEFWCADFVSWVFNEAGSPFTGGVSGGWRLPGVAGMKSWFSKNATYVDKAASPGDIPQRGDVIFFKYPTSNESTATGDHVGIVEFVEGTTIHTIEGNTSNAVLQRTYDISKPSIMGWGRK